MGKSRRKFSIIELLIIISVIAVLAAILLPVSTSKSKSQQAICLSNLKRLSMGMIMYCQDYNRVMPTLYNIETCIEPDGRTAPNRLWLNKIYPYVKSTGVYNCPSNSDLYKGNYYWLKSDGNLGNAAYGLNMWAISSISWNRYLSLDDAKTPAETPIIGDCDYYAMTPWRSGTMAQNSLPPNEKRHTEFIDMGFLDGHAKAVKYASWTTSTPPQSRSSADPIWVKWDPKLQ